MIAFAGRQQSWQHLRALIHLNGGTVAGLPLEAAMVAAAKSSQRGSQCNSDFLAGLITLQQRGMARPLVVDPLGGDGSGSRGSPLTAASMVCARMCLAAGADCEPALLRQYCQRWKGAFPPSSPAMATLTAEQARQAATARIVARVQPPREGAGGGDDAMGEGNVPSLQSCCRLAIRSRLAATGRLHAHGIRSLRLSRPLEHVLTYGMMADECPLCRPDSAGDGITHGDGCDIGPGDGIGCAGGGGGGGGGGWSYCEIRQQHILTQDRPYPSRVVGESCIVTAE